MLMCCHRDTGVANGSVVEGCCERHAHRVRPYGEVASTAKGVACRLWGLEKTRESVSGQPAQAGFAAEPLGAALAASPFASIVRVLHGWGNFFSLLVGQVLAVRPDTRRDGGEKMLGADEAGQFVAGEHVSERGIRAG